MKLVWKLLKHHISIPQLVGFFLANLAGMVIILLGLQFYLDYRALENEESFMKSDYLIVNKKITTMSVLTGSQSTFEEAEVEALGNEDFVERIGVFTPSSFDVYAQFNVEGFVNFSTEMFFESVPDVFVDVESEAWTYNEGDADIPIILPKNYLDLYNLGYAQGKGMPKLSEGLIGALKLDILIGNQGIRDKFVGKIVGFSSRLNTILVPEQFMLWANKKYASADAAKEPTRLILEVNNPADERITSYLQEHNYETDEGKLDASKMTFILQLLVGIVMLVGAVICILSFCILMLSIFLLVEKNSAKLENLLLIGYSPAKVAFPYVTLTISMNALVLIMAVLIMQIVRSAYLNMFEGFFQNYDAPSVLPSLCVGFLLLLVVSAFNVVAIRGKVQGIWKAKR